MAYDLASAIDRIEAAAVLDAKGDTTYIEWEAGDTYAAPEAYILLPKGGKLPAGVACRKQRDGVSVTVLPDGRTLIKDRWMSAVELKAIHAAALGGSLALLSRDEAKEVIGAGG